MKNAKRISRSIDFTDASNEIKYNETFLITGVIEDFTFLQTKKTKENWATMTIRDYWGPIEVMVFSKVFSESEAILSKGVKSGPILISGYAHNQEEQIKIIAQKIEPLIEIFVKVNSV
jgi:DNA polymerase III alpha subunit